MANGTSTRVKTWGNFIDGEWRPSRSGRLFEDRNPADRDDLIGVFQESDAADVDAAVDAAARAYRTWRLVPAPKRAEILFRAAELIAARAAWEASAGTVQQAGRAHEIADVRYRAGVSTQLELSDARLLLQQAEVNRAQAARDLQVARARMALLPDLPIGATPAPRLQPVQPQQAPPATQPAPVPGGGNGAIQAGGFQSGGFQAGIR